MLVARSVRLQRSHRLRRRAPLAALPLIFGLACNVTSDGGVGDPPSEPEADPLGSGLRVSDLVKEATWFEPDNLESTGCAYPGSRTANLTGQVIVAIDRYDETGDGARGNIYVEDVLDPDEDVVPFSGMTVFGPAFTPPDLRVFEGDVMDTFGVFVEFPGPSSGPFSYCATLPEIGGTMVFRFERSEPVRPFTVVRGDGDNSRWDPVKGYPNARQWLGMLVRFENVVVATPEESGGRYAVPINMGGGLAGDDVVKISNELFDLKNDGPELSDGTQLKAVTGVITYFYGFKIAPRSIDDFEL
jgi:hypothetical protein